MYRRPKFLEVLLEIRREMALDAGYDVDRFAQQVRSGDLAAKAKPRPSDRMNAEPETEITGQPKLVKTPER